MAHISHLALPITIAIGLFVIGIFGLLFFERKVNYSRSIVLILGSYGLVVSEIFVIIYSIAHIHSWYKFHFHIPSLSDHDYFSQSNPVHLPSILIISLAVTIAVFFLALIISQISLRIISSNLKGKRNKKFSEELRNKYDWLPKDYQVVVVNDEQLDAFTFTLLKRGANRLKAENWIILTSGLIQILNEEEIEMVIAHEFSHTSDYDTRYSHLIYTIATIFFFDPMLKLFKFLIHEKHEYNADSQAVKLINKPRTLANALFKMLKGQINISKRRISTGIISSKKPLIIRRIEKLLEYAELNKLNQ